MEIILLDKIRNVGKLGDKVSVKPGYGRNYLIPQGKAIPATTSNLAKFEARRAELEKAAAEAVVQANQRKVGLEQIVVTINAKAGEEGKLFGSVGVHDLTHAITNAGGKIEKSEVRLPTGPLRQIGEYMIELHLHSDVIANVKVNVVSQ